MIKAIDQESIHRICSSQVVVDLATAVKEMVENALDAEATFIEVKLKNMGIDSIEVSDNGYGINPHDYEGIAQKHHTSKLQQFEDLFSVDSFGFRGEALNALCELSHKFTVTTRRADESVGALLTFDRFGRYLQFF
jgi:DNA mismatch repair protein PMS2